jgi:hypothetical protein
MNNGRQAQGKRPEYDKAHKASREMGLALFVHELFMSRPKTRSLLSDRQASGTNPVTGASRPELERPRMALGTCSTLRRGGRLAFPD